MDIIEEIGMDEMMCQLAEECCELAKAALKYHRILVGRNPTPVTEPEAIDALTEESQDVQDCLLLLEEHGIKISDLAQSARKMERWAARITERKEDERHWAARIEAREEEEKPEIPLSEFCRLVIKEAQRMEQRGVTPGYLYVKPERYSWLIRESAVVDAPGYLPTLMGMKVHIRSSLPAGTLFAISDTNYAAPHDEANSAIVYIPEQYRQEVRERWVQR